MLEQVFGDRMFFLMSSLYIMVSAFRLFRIRLFHVRLFRVCLFRIRLFHVHLFRVCLFRIRLFRVRLLRVRLFRVCLFRVRLFRILLYRVRLFHIRLFAYYYNNLFVCKPVHRRYIFCLDFVSSFKFVICLLTYMWEQRFFLKISSFRLTWWILNLGNSSPSYE